MWGAAPAAGLYWLAVEYELTAAGWVIAVLLTLATFGCCGRMIYQRCGDMDDDEEVHKGAEDVDVEAGQATQNMDDDKEVGQGTDLENKGSDATPHQASPDQLGHRCEGVQAAGRQEGTGVSPAQVDTHEPWQWQVKDASGSWVDYEHEANELIELHRAESVDNCVVGIGKFAYEIDFRALTQTNMETKMVREVRHYTDLENKGSDSTPRQASPDQLGHRYEGVQDAEPQEGTGVSPAQVDLQCEAVQDSGMQDHVGVPPAPSQSYEVVVPPGFGPGSIFQAQLGGVIRGVQVPPNGGPGCKLQIPV